MLRHERRNSVPPFSDKSKKNDSEESPYLSGQSVTRNPTSKVRESRISTKGSSPAQLTATLSRNTLPKTTSRIHSASQSPACSYHSRLSRRTVISNEPFTGGSRNMQTQNFPREVVNTELKTPSNQNQDQLSSPPPQVNAIWNRPDDKRQTQANSEAVQQFGAFKPQPSPGIKIPVFKSDTDQRKDPKSKARKGMNWKDYHRLAVLDSFLDDMEINYPSLCTVGIIGKSIEGRNIKLLKVSDSNATNAAVWIDSGIHAREWIGPAVNTYVANHIVKNFDKLPKYVTNKDWYFLPVINPDGYEYSHTENRMWRKNRAWCGGKCVGVDLNRNFSFGWGGRGSSDNPTHSFYRGTAPFSEPEAQAVRNVIGNESNKFKVYITLHSYGQVIIFPFACREDLCPNYIHLLQGATVMSRAIYETNGNVYKVGISKDVMYKASGTSNDWSHGVVGIPYCYLIELRSRKHKFKVPEEEIEETGTEILNCVIALLEHLDKKEYEGEELRPTTNETHTKNLYCHAHAN